MHSIAVSFIIKWLRLRWFRLRIRWLSSLLASSAIRQSSATSSTTWQQSSIAKQTTVCTREGVGLPPMKVREKKIVKCNDQKNEGRCRSMHLLSTSDQRRHQLWPCAALFIFKTCCVAHPRSIPGSILMPMRVQLTAFFWA